MTLPHVKRSYLRWRSEWYKARRRVQGDWEYVVGCRQPERAALRELRNRHFGKVAWLVGNGPSVTPSDLDRLRSHVTFCCNRFYLAYEKTALRPTYLCSADPLMIRDFGPEMLARAETRVVFMSVERPGLAGDFQWIEIDSEGPFFFTRNALKPMHPGGGTLIAALQFGYWMGIRRFILYGVDHSFPADKQTAVGTDGRSTFVTGEGNHFIPDYRAGRVWVAPWTNTIEAAFRKCDAVLRRQGGWLINATRTTRLPDIERVPLELALERAAAVTG